MSTSGSTPPGDGPPGDAADRRHQDLQALPGIGDDPVVWDPRAGGFVPAAHAGAAPAGAWPSDVGPYGAAPAAGPVPPDGDATRAQPEVPDQPAVAPAGAKRHVVINAGEQAVRPAAAGGAGTAAPPVPGWSPPSPGPPRPPGPPPGPRPQHRPPPGPGPSGPRRTYRRPRFPVRRVVGIFLSIPVLIGLVLFGLAWQKFEQIPRVPVASVLSAASGTGTNWLIVGTDSREGTTDEGATVGNRTDSIMVLRVAADGTQSLLSIPRDLWVKDPKSGQNGRINGTYNAGPANLIAAVQGVGIPVHHYMEINFVGFGELVDAVGGIDIEFALPARDTHSGLYVETAGVNRLNGEQALAYVRSRYYEELKDGRWKSDPLADLSRVKRQRTFLTALMSKVSDTRNPFALFSIMGAMAEGLRIDDTLNLFDAMGLALDLRKFHPESVTLPVVNASRGGAMVLDLNKAEAAAVIAKFSS